MRSELFQIAWRFFDQPFNGARVIIEDVWQSFRCVSRKLTGIIASLRTAFRRCVGLRKIPHNGICIPSSTETLIGVANFVSTTGVEAKGGGGSIERYAAVSRAVPRTVDGPSRTWKVAFVIVLPVNFSQDFLCDLLWFPKVGRVRCG